MTSLTSRALAITSILLARIAIKTFYFYKFVFSFNDVAWLKALRGFIKKEKILLYYLLKG